MSHHVREICPTCGTVVKQCRCMAEKVTTVAEEPCRACKVKTNAELKVEPKRGNQ